MGFLEWLLSMEVMFGWLLPFCFSMFIIEMIKGTEQSSFIRYCLAFSCVIWSIFLYIICIKKFKKKQKQEEIIKETERKEKEQTIYSSPIKNLTPLQFEQFTAKYIKNRGYYNVQLTKKSNDYGADIIAKHPSGKLICIQCKKYTKPVGVKAVQEIVAARLHYGCELAAVATTSCGYTKQAIELANDNNVDLYFYDDAKHYFIQRLKF